MVAHRLVNDEAADEKGVKTEVSKEIPPEDNLELAGKQPSMQAVADSCWMGPDFHVLHNYLHISMAINMAVAMGISMTVAIGTRPRTSEMSARTGETSAITTETNAKTSETNARTIETNARTIETTARTIETNVRTNETIERTNDVQVQVVMHHMAVVSLPGNWVSAWWGSACQLGVCQALGLPNPLNQ